VPYNGDLFVPLPSGRASETIQERSRASSLCRRQLRPVYHKLCNEEGTTSTQKWKGHRINIDSEVEESQRQSSPCSVVIARRPTVSEPDLALRCNLAASTPAHTRAEKTVRERSTREAEESGVGAVSRQNISPAHRSGAVHRHPRRSDSRCNCAVATSIRNIPAIHSRYNS
jgi:hypothetical protein